MQMHVLTCQEVPHTWGCSAWAAGDPMSVLRRAQQPIAPALDGVQGVDHLLTSWRGGPPAPSNRAPAAATGRSQVRETQRQVGRSGSPAGAQSRSPERRQLLRPGGPAPRRLSHCAVHLLPRLQQRPGSHAAPLACDRSPSLRAAPPGAGPGPAGRHAACAQHNGPQGGRHSDMVRSTRVMLLLHASSGPPWPYTSCRAL